jgi:ketosteroid isomerase-like protein
MNRRAWIVVALTAVTGGCGSTVNVGRERTLLLETDKQWSEASNDVDKFVSYYSSDASLYPPGAPVVKGAAAIRDAYSKMSSAPGFSLKWTPTTATVSGAGDLGYTTGTYRMTMNDPSGSMIVDRGKYVSVWKKSANAQWKVAEDIFNSDAPPPAPEPKVAPPPEKPAAAAKSKAKPKKSPAKKRK